MKAFSSIWRPLLVGLSPILALVTSAALLIGAAALFLALFFVLINVPIFYDARENLGTYTGKSISANSRIEHFMVRNFFYLDGPDYYFELKLTPTDRTRLIDYFRQHSHGEGFNQTADSAVPPSWHVGDTSEYEQHFLSDEQRGAAVMLSLDSSGERAWLVIYNF